MIGFVRVFPLKPIIFMKQKWYLIFHSLHSKHQAGTGLGKWIPDICIYISKLVSIFLLTSGKNCCGSINKLVQRAGAIPLKQQGHCLFLILQDLFAEQVLVKNIVSLAYEFYQCCRVVGFFYALPFLLDFCLADIVDAFFG